MEFYVYAILIASILLVYFFNKQISYKKYAIKKIEVKYKPVTPQNTIITFDLHDVLVKYDYKAIFNNLWQCDKKFNLFIALLNPFFLYDVVKLLLQHAVAEQYIVGLGNKYKRLTPFIPLGIKIANCQKPVPQMLNLLKELKQTGYTLHLFSNIGAKILDDFKKQLPDLFQYLEKVTVPSEKNGYLRKPYQKAFENFTKQHNKHNKQIIFIDDKIKNIKTADKNKIIGILFQNPKQLRETFKSTGIIK